MPLEISTEALKCPNAMKTRSIDNLAVIDKDVKSMLLIEFLDVVSNPKPKWNTGQVKVGKTTPEALRKNFCKIKNCDKKCYDGAA